MDNNRLEAGVIAAVQGSLTAKIDAQTIYHLLIEKGICTREEIQAKKAYIAKQYQKEQEAIIELDRQNEEHFKDEEMIKKALAGDEEAKTYMLNRIDSIKKNL